MVLKELIESTTCFTCNRNHSYIQIKDVDTDAGMTVLQCGRCDTHILRDIPAWENEETRETVRDELNQAHTLVTEG